MEEKMLHNGIETEISNMTPEELKAYYEKDPMGYYQMYVKASVSPAYDLKLAALGTAEELGEVAGVIMKMARYSDPEYFQKKWGMSAQSKLADEIGDLLFQLNNICNFAGLDLKQVMTDNLEKLDRRHASSDGEYYFGSGLGNTRADGGHFRR